MEELGMLIPFLKISDHYSASDRAGLKRLEKNLKIKKRKQWGLAKRKRLKPPKKRAFKRKKTSKKKVQKKEIPLKKESSKRNPLKERVSQKGFNVSF